MPFDRVPLSSGTTREEVFAYLQELFQAGLGLTSVRRGYPAWSGLFPAQSPLGFMHVSGSRGRTAPGLPPLYNDSVTLWVGVAQPSGDLSTVNQTALLNLRDALDALLLPDQPDRHVCTLQGRAVSARVVQDFYQESPSTGAWTSFVSRLNVRYLSAYNR
jgi:hypothetical protein